MSREARGLLRFAGFLARFLAGLPLLDQVVNAPKLQVLSPSSFVPAYKPRWSPIQHSCDGALASYECAWFKAAIKKGIKPITSVNACTTIEASRPYLLYK